jgi:hypothetical protein
MARISTRYRWSLAVIAVAVLAVGAALADDSPRPVRRQGVFMGLDPGLALRLEGDLTPLYARLDLRIGGCVTPWFHLGADWRGDLAVTQVPRTPETRHEIGPVASFFLVEGWFARVFVHLAGVEPVSITAGGQTGYEFSMGRFSAIGFFLGADVDLPVNGQPPIAYSFSAGLYLTAYDLGSRRGREFDL